MSRRAPVIASPVVVYESPKKPYDPLSPPIRVVKYRREDGTAASLVEEMRRSDPDALGKQVDYWRGCGAKAEEVLYEICEHLAEMEAAK